MVNRNVRINGKGHHCLRSFPFVTILKYLIAAVEVPNDVINTLIFISAQIDGQTDGLTAHAPTWNRFFFQFVSHRFGD